MILSPLLMVLLMPRISERATARTPVAKPPPLSCLIVGGGPNRENNGATIEAHVRFVSSVLPKGTYRRILFADGNKKSPTVKVRVPFLFKGSEATALTIFADVLADTLNTEDSKTLDTPAVHVLGQMGKSVSVDFDTLTLFEQGFRPPKLPDIHGVANQTSVFTELAELGHRSPSPVLIYFAGHGEGGHKEERQNTAYDFWSEENSTAHAHDKTENTIAELSAHPPRVFPVMGDSPLLTVRDLAAAIAPVPKDRPITLVMVQCYGGGFGNLLFEKGEANGAFSDRPLCGFFATLFDRLAAGCGVESRLSNQDFTATFFAALVGHDAEGKSVSAKDYDGDGKISMYEAYLYSIINDSSIDIPVATSDILLRRMVSVPDLEIAALDDRKIREIATENDNLAMGHRMQVDVLDGLLQKLREFRGGDLSDPSSDTLALAWEEVKPKANPTNRRQGSTNRGMGFPNSPERLLASLQAIDPQIRDEPQIKPILQRHTALTPEDKSRISGVIIPLMEPVIREVTRRSESGQLRSAYLRRYWEFTKTIVLQKRLREIGTPADLARLERLRQLEYANPLVKAGT